MSTLSEHNGNGNPTETHLQREDTQEQSDGLLQHFEVLPSKLDRFIFRYIIVFLIGNFFLFELAFIFLPGISLLQGGEYLLGSGLIVLITLAIILALWRFNVWRLHAPKTLCDLLEKKRIYVPDGDANSSYLCFLKHYRDTLASPKRYFLSGFLMITVGILYAYRIVHYLISIEHPNSFVTILVVVVNLLVALVYLGGTYCIGIAVWVIYISGCYVRKLVRAFEFRILPFHPDQCGGLKLLGNFCFDLLSPILIGSGLLIGWILLYLISGINAVYLTLNVGFSFIVLLLYALPAAIFAFFLPLSDIHTKMVSEGEADEDTYSARIEALWEEIQSLLDTNQVEAAKAVQEKKALEETLYIPYPIWPFHVRSKIFSTILGASGSLLIGLITAALQQYFLPAILTPLFHTP